MESPQVETSLSDVNLEIVQVFEDDSEYIRFNLDDQTTDAPAYAIDHHFRAGGGRMAWEENMTRMMIC